MRTFELKADHIKLLRHAFVYWQDCEFGAPEIDPKRPYGNSSVVPDIAEILGIEPDEHDSYGPGFSRALRERLTALHRETETALQIVLATTSFEPGTYETAPYPMRWRRLL